MRIGVFGEAASLFDCIHDSRSLDEAYHSGSADFPRHVENDLGTVAMR